MISSTNYIPAIFGFMIRNYTAAYDFDTESLLLIKHMGAMLLEKDNLTVKQLNITPEKLCYQLPA